MKKQTTRINNSSDLREVLNENLEGLLTGTRERQVAVAITQLTGRLLADVKMEMVNNAAQGYGLRSNFYQPLNETLPVSKADSKRAIKKA